MPEADENQPVVILVNKVHELLSSSTSEPIIDLSEKFNEFFQPPYGLYGNPISYAAVSIALRPYIDKLFVARDGTKVDKTIMRDIVEYLFKAASGGKKHHSLDVRFSSVEEIELIEELNGIFNLTENGLMHIRWKARDSFEKNVQAPLWMLKYVNDDITPELSKVIDDLFTFTIAPEEVITQSIISSLLTSIQNYRMELITTIAKAKNAGLLDKYIRLTLKDKTTSISDDDLKEYKEYIEEHMQDSRPHWIESQLNVQINAAYFNKLTKEIEAKQKKPDEIVPTQPADENEPTAETNNNETNNYKIKKEKTKKCIENCNNVDKLKSILLELVDSNNDNIAEQILKKFNL